MKAFQPLPLLAVASLATASTIALSQDAAPTDVRHVMQQQVNPAIVAIWDVTNNAITDSGDLDGGAISPEQWAQIARNAGLMAQASDAMAVAPQLVAADPSNWATAEEEVPMDQVQASLDAAPDGFRAMSASFARTARALEAAATARDVARTAELVGTMDAQCEACHSVYWYATY